MKNLYSILLCLSLLGISEKAYAQKNNTDLSRITTKYVAEYFEKEPNNEFITATHIAMNKYWKGFLMSTADMVDVFYFEIPNRTNIDITILNKQHIRINYALYHSSNLKEPISSSFNNSPIVQGKHFLTHGRYYLVLSNPLYQTGEYELKLSDDVKLRNVQGSDVKALTRLNKFY